MECLNVIIPANIEVKKKWINGFHSKKMNEICHSCGNLLEQYSNVNLCKVCYSQALDDFEKLISDLYE